MLRLACTSPGEPEIFRSIQGEGRNMGRLRTFVRLSGCNLQCTWCDTPYTWNWHGTQWPHDLDRQGAPHKFDPDEETVALPPEAVAERVAQLPSEGVVLTGGEPFVQARALPSLIRALKAGLPGLLVEIETNGTIAPAPPLLDAIDLLMVSPKLGHAGNRLGSALRPRALRALAATAKAEFKFVARDPADVAEVQSLAAEYGIVPSRIYIMPEGRSGREVSERGAALIDTVIAAGFNYSDRLHLHLFGDRRGT